LDGYFYHLPYNSIEALKEAQRTDLDQRPPTSSVLYSTPNSEEKGTAPLRALLTNIISLMPLTSRNDKTTFMQAINQLTGQSVNELINKINQLLVKIILS